MRFCNFPLPVVFLERNPITTMKTALISFLAATATGLVFFASGAIDTAEFTALFFAAGLAAWTLEQYSREYRPLNLARPIRLPAPLGVRHVAPRVGRLAA